MDKKKIMNWVIAIIVAIVYLSISIIFDAWAYSWLIWVVYAIYRFIAKQTNYNLQSRLMSTFSFDLKVCYNKIDFMRGSDFYE